MGLDLECGDKWGRFSYSGFARYRMDWMRVLLEYVKTIEKHDKTLSGLVEVYERIVKDKEITEEIFLRIYETYNKYAGHACGRRSKEQSEGDLE